MTLRHKFITAFPSVVVPLSGCLNIVVGRLCISFLELPSKGKQIVIELGHSGLRPVVDNLCAQSALLSYSYQSDSRIASFSKSNVNKIH